MLNPKVYSDGWCPPTHDRTVIVTDRETMKPSTVFAITVCAIANTPNGNVSICRVKATDVPWFCNGAWRISEFDKNNLNYSFMVEGPNHKDGIPYGAAGISWSMFGKTLIKRLGYTTSIKKIWQVIDQNIALKFDGMNNISHEQDNQPLLENPTDEKYDDALGAQIRAMEDYLRREIAIAAKSL
jgi:hypothetical protein